jgi:hypothetical protein
MKSPLTKSSFFKRLNARVEGEISRKSTCPVEGIETIKTGLVFSGTRFLFSGSMIPY